jgi:hypothetical protein
VELEMKKATRIGTIIGTMAKITIRPLVSVICPPTKNPAHNEPDLLNKVVEAAGVEPA